VRELQYISARIRQLVWALLLILVLVPWGDVRADNFAFVAGQSLESSQRKANKRGADNWWARDKRIHLLVSAGMVGTSYHLLHDQWNCRAEDSRRIAVSVTALAGLLKEFTDARKVPPSCSYKDLIADGVGLLVGILVFTR
jgi:uncharacterized protein YfiM (DUF2279 family)